MLSWLYGLCRSGPEGTEGGGDQDSGSDGDGGHGDRC